MVKLWIYSLVLCFTALTSVVQAQLTCENNLFVTYTIKPRTRLVDSTSTVVRYQYIADASTCFTNCRALSCKAFNYNNVSKDCEVLESDDKAMLQGDSRWMFYDVLCGTSEPETSPEPEGEAEAEVTLEDVWNYFRDNPEYIAMIGMGLVIFLLFLTIIVILCCYTGRRRSDDYTEKP